MCPLQEGVGCYVAEREVIEAVEEDMCAGGESGRNNVSEA